MYTICGKMKYQKRKCYVKLDYFGMRNNEDKFGSMKKNQQSGYLQNSVHTIYFIILCVH
jgi:hypothetical protein